MAVVFTVTPSTVTARGRQVIQMVASVPVNWSVPSSANAILRIGDSFTAYLKCPAEIAAGQTIVVTATATADGTSTHTCTITVATDEAAAVATTLTAQKVEPYIVAEIATAIQNAEVETSH